MAKQGIDAKKYTDALASFGVQGKVARSKQLSTAYGVNGVPTIVVAGKYQTSASTAGGHEGALKVTDYLINLVRRERGGK
jgi:thiol:disulfide interchange protein DsbA